MNKTSLLFIGLMLQSSLSLAAEEFSEKFVFKKLSEKIAHSKIGTHAEHNFGSQICEVFGVAPDYGQWAVKFIDVEGPYVALKYTNDQAPVSLPKHIIFVWNTNAQYAPWIAYFGNEDVSEEIRLNHLGDLAFWRFQGPTLSNPVPQMELRVCRLDHQNLATQLGAYPCSLDIHQGHLVDTIPSNATILTPFGIQSNQPDGRFRSMDWSADKLLYSRSRYVQPFIELSTWDLLTQSKVQIDLAPTVPNAVNDYYINQVDSQGTVGYTTISFTNFVGGVVGVNTYGAFPVPVTGQGIVYQAPNFAELQPNSFNSIRSGAFLKFSNEYHSFFSSLVLPTPGSTASLVVKTNQDNFQNAYSLSMPQGQVKAYKPMKTISQIFGELLLVESWNSANVSRVEVFTYQPASPGGAGLGNYNHLTTFAAPAPFTHVTLSGATDFGDGGFSVILHNGSALSGRRALVRCL